MSEYRFLFAPASRITVHNLIGNDGYGINEITSDGEGLMWLLQGPNFLFRLQIIDGHIEFKRNEFEVKLPVPRCSNGGWLLLFMWRKDQLVLRANCIGEQPETAKVNTLSTIVPNDVVLWARKLDSKETATYDSTTALAQKVISILESAGNDISQTYGGYEQFWNITKNGGKITNRHPKDETEIHGAIHSIIQSYVRQSGLDLQRESQYSTGKIDFTFSGVVNDGGIKNIAVEFKNAHSPDLIDGIKKQLPTYMDTIGADYGIYVVLNYQGEWFAKPKLTKAQLLAKLQTSPELAYSRRITVLIFDLSKPHQASK